MAKSIIFSRHNTGMTEVEVTSYVTQGNLKKALEKYGFEKDHHIELQLADGRWTAIFSAARLHAEGGYIGIYADKGFMMIG